jgi:dolichol kinase
MVNVTDRLKDAKKKINSIDFDAHWYRRAFHAFGASFLLYYLLPDIDWINVLKLWVPPLIVLFVIILEVLRLSGKISSDYFFGLRMYEQKRIGSYVFFAVAILILLRFFPQQIAIPCILCATLGDPIIGEIRKRYSMNYVYIIGFFVCMYFFIITWFKADVFLIILVSVVGGFSALIGETKKFWWLDDDFMIQMLPALLLLIIWISIPHLGLSYPDDIIYPIIFSG